MLGALALLATASPSAMAASTSAVAIASGGTNLGAGGLLDNHTATSSTGAVSFVTAGVNSSGGTSDAAAASAYAYAAVGHLAAGAGSTASVTSTLLDSQGNLNSQGIDAGAAQAEATVGWRDVTHVKGANGGYYLAKLLLTGSNSATVSVGQTIYTLGANGSLAYFTDSASASVTLTAYGLDPTSFDGPCTSVSTQFGSQMACARSDANYFGNPKANYDAGTIHSVDLKIPIDVMGNAQIAVSMVADSAAAAAGQYYKASGGASGSGNADLTHTLLWGGISGIYDASGNLVSGATVTSDLGFNYMTAAAPEPGQWVLVTLGLGGMGAALRRRQRRAVA